MGWYGLVWVWFGIGVGRNEGIRDAKRLEGDRRRKGEKVKRWKDGKRDKVLCGCEWKEFELNSCEKNNKGKEWKLYARNPE